MANKRPYKPVEAEVILMTDNREKRNAQDINYFFDRFVASNIKTELRSNVLGDFLWVLRIHNNELDDDDDLVDEIDNPNPDFMDDNASKIKKKKK